MKLSLTTLKYFYEQNMHNLKVQQNMLPFCKARKKGPTKIVGLAFYFSLSAWIPVAYKAYYFENIFYFNIFLYHQTPYGL